MPSSYDIVNSVSLATLTTRLPELYGVVMHRSTVFSPPDKSKDGSRESSEWATNLPNFLGTVQLNSETIGYSYTKGCGSEICSNSHV
jgi:hypothetical protein